jgi:hypothetical protein
VNLRLGPAIKALLIRESQYLRSANRLNKSEVVAVAQHPRRGTEHLENLRHVGSSDSAFTNLGRRGHEGHSELAPSRETTR